MIHIWYRVSIAIYSLNDDVSTIHKPACLLIDESSSRFEYEVNLLFWRWAKLLLHFLHSKSVLPTTQHTCRWRLKWMLGLISAAPCSRVKASATVARVMTFLAETVPSLLRSWHSMFAMIMMVAAPGWSVDWFHQRQDHVVSMITNDVKYTSLQGTEKSLTIAVDRLCFNSRDDYS